MTDPNPSPAPPQASTTNTSEQLKRLLDQLHAANEHFSAARQHLETALDCTGWDCPNPEVAEQELRNAHAQLEQISAKIHAMLEATSGPGNQLR